MKKLKIKGSFWVGLVGLLGLVTGCGSTATSTPPNSAAANGASTEFAGPAEPERSELTRQDHVCEAARSGETDPVRRWIPVFPVHQGGAVVVFTGSYAEPAQVETALEASGIAGYEDFACDSEVVVWIPGFDCQGDSDTLTSNIEANTTMRDLESACFAIDEVRMRLEIDCREGILSGDYCP